LFIPVKTRRRDMVMKKAETGKNCLPPTFEEPVLKNRDIRGWFR